MLRKCLDHILFLTQKEKPLYRFRFLVRAIDTFLYEVKGLTQCAPHIRNATDVKRWMMLVFLALLPCIVMAIWNSGLQKFVYESGNFELAEAYLKASHSFSSYFSFCFSKGRYLSILQGGIIAFIPVMLISYLVGGFWEVLFATVRRHEVSEGFLVTGILFALILPSTIPYWMVAVGVSFGVVVGKEIFGGTGMNVLNPALLCRAFLFFSFPAKMTGAVWVGTHPTLVQESLEKINQEIQKETNEESFDGISQNSALNFFNISSKIKRIHIDAIGLYFKEKVKTLSLIEKQFRIFRQKEGSDKKYERLSQEELGNFLTASFEEGGLNLPSEYIVDAYHFAQLRFGKKGLSDANFFFGNQIGSMGETSILACLIGALLLLLTRIGSFHTMSGCFLGAFFSATLFFFFAEHFGEYGGAFNAAKYVFPPYKHFLLGSLIFGLVFMATDPVSSPTMGNARFIYGIFIGAITIIIRLINPAFPEGVMLSILLGNVFAPLFDHISVNRFYKKYGKQKEII